MGVLASNIDTKSDGFKANEAAMQASVGQARRIRERLGVREARGDQMYRRYLNRVEV